MHFFGYSFVLLLAALPYLLALIDCDNVAQSAAAFQGSCNNKWHNLKPLIRPTQQQIGFAWVQRKLDQSFSSAGNAQAEMDSTPVPAVLGPTESGGSAFYIVDHHHELAALDYSGYDRVSVTLSVTCDRRDLDLDSFWQWMEEQEKVFLLSHPANEPNVLPVKVTVDDLPDRFSFTKDDQIFTDDPWRSLASFVRKVTNAACTKDGYDKYCERCYIRECSNNGTGIPFYEFKWAYFFNEAYFEAEWWPSLTTSADFYDVFGSLEMANVGGIDTNAWEDAAEALIPLCRGSGAGQYELPASKFNELKLPGYVEGYKPLDPDPECSPDWC